MARNKPINVLVFPGGMENGLEIGQSLRYCKEIKLFSASAPGSNHAEFAFINNFPVRDVREAGWVNELNNVIVSNKIAVIYPANSLVIDHLLENRAKLAAPVLLPSSDVVKLTRSKKQTLATLADLLPVPACYASADQIPHYPAFTKPDKGYGSQGAFIVHNKTEANSIDFTNNIVQELLTGKEYTVDCFSDMEGKLLYSCARERVRVRMATSMHAEAAPAELDQQMNTWANTILSRIKLTGAWFFQVKADTKGNLKLLEIDARIAGTMCYSRVRGVNFALLSIHQFMGREVSILVNQQPLVLDRCLRNRYKFDYKYDTVYVDLDDTLVLRGEINTQLVQFLFQCLNKKIRLVLLTKSLEKDITKHLQDLRIHQIFDDIIQIEENHNKADYVTSKSAIFIDDSFSQRVAVSAKCHIPTFDATMIEGLIDERA